MAPFLPDRDAARASIEIGDRTFLHDLTADDLALANACIAIEREVRDDAVRAIERLGAPVPDCEGDLDDRLRALPAETLPLAAAHAWGAFLIY